MKEVALKEVAVKEVGAKEVKLQPPTRISRKNWREILVSEPRQTVESLWSMRGGQDIPPRFSLGLWYETFGGFRPRSGSLQCRPFPTQLLLSQEVIDQVTASVLNHETTSKPHAQLRV